MRIRKLEGEGERWTKAILSVRREVMIKQVALEVREHIVIMISGEAARGLRGGERRGRSREGERRVDATEGEEMNDRTAMCGEEEERVMDTTVGSNAAETTRELVMVLGKDTSRNLEVKGQIEPDKGQVVVVGVGRTITSQMLTQQKTNLFLGVRGKRDTEKMLCHQHQLELEMLELD